MKTLKNSSYTKGNEGFADISREILAKPIGIVRKNHKTIEKTLQRNIGNRDYKFDGFGTAISDNSQTDLNSRVFPWFKLDNKRNDYSNYIDYMKDVYGLTTTFRFPMNSDDLLKNDIIVDSAVGVVRGYDFNKENNVLSPNQEHDTRLGYINNHYLSTTLLNSYNYNKKRSKKEITHDVYYNFDTYGRFGIANGASIHNMERTLDNIEIHNGATGIMPRLFHDFINYGGYEDSEVLMINTDEMTREFIIKSLLGIDLSKRDIKVGINSLNIDWSLVSNKRYYPSKSGFDYLSQTFGNGLVYKTNKELHNDISHTNAKDDILMQYAEYGGNPQSTNNQGNSGTNYGKHQIFTIDDTRNDLVKYTNEKFISGEYKSLVARFHTDNSDPNFSQINSAVSQYGMSRGRNLLKKDHMGSDTNSYSDPYCRVWTYHKQYSKLNSLIRPFSDNDDIETLDKSLEESYQVNRHKIRQDSVKQSNGLVQIAPTKGTKTNIRKCMFSLENLAWKHEKVLTYGYEDQIGPLGGRIMWFPPYGLTFNESVNVNWTPNNFIGRGEPIYTYTNTDRSGNLSFKLLIDHPSLINKFRGDGNDGLQGVDNTESKEQTLLRFFAGCEVLVPPKKEESKTDDKIEDIEIPYPQIPTTNSVEKRIVFYVFFPNNYSGVDDKVDGIVKPMHYLINGLGAQLVKKSDEHGGLVETLPTSFEDYGEYGGYEVGKKGISCLGSFYPQFDINTVNGNKLVSQVGYVDSLNNNNVISDSMLKDDKVRYWAYRVDMDYENQNLDIKNYGDVTSYQLNSQGYNTSEMLKQKHSDINTYIDNGELYSFYDVFTALEKGFEEHAKHQNKDRVKEIRSIFDTYDIKSVEYHGFASSAGYKNSNDELGKNRANSVHKWLMTCDSRITDDYLYKTNEIGSVNSKDVCSEEHKAYRCTKVIINFINENVVDLIEQSILNDNQVKYVEKVLEKYRDTEYGKTLSNVSIGSGMYKTLSDVQKIALISLLDMAKQESEKEKIEASKKGNINESKFNVNTYGKEYEFFDEISKEDSLLHHRLKDKIKYFDPAFHSISPEGFNARLNFLHQCTRQGSTYSVADPNDNKTARNLSFGAPPVCVLRLGDFFNTKIIIESLNITYDDTTWDLNDEGIGVMPMMADINIGFKFLGGSDMTGPIARLQNAVSFNYYANTIAYDDRAEEIFYDKDGNIRDIKIKQ